jgi:hypothetical protein
MRVKTLFFAIIASLFFLSSSNVYARSGCCSWHSGVCGCSQTGRQICCDGSLSPSCTCYTPPPSPQPTPIIIPTTLQGDSTYNYNNTTKSYDVTFNWDDWNQSNGWSVGISQYAGVDPGPNMDTISSIWTFKNVYPGKKYVNMKASVSGYWSRITYWTINVPAIPTPTPTPTITPTSTITLSPKPTEIIRKTNQRKNFWQWIFGK